MVASEPVYPLVYEFRCQQVSKTYSGRGQALVALDGLTLHAAPQEFVAIVGPSGCGKSTLLKLLAGVLQPSQGQIEFAQPAAPPIPRCAMVFQDHGLFPWLTILDNVAFGLEAQGHVLAERRRAAQAGLQRMGLAAFATHYPGELSGGMRQRAGLARAFLSAAPILLLDEPFGALDAQTRLLLQQELLERWSLERKTVVYVTHDIEEAILLGDRVLVMSSRPGRILSEHIIALPRPRPLDALSRHPELLQLKWQIWKLIEGEVRRAMEQVL